MTCSASELVSAAQALAGLARAQLQGIKTYLLAKRANANPATLALIGGFSSLSPEQLAAFRIALIGAQTGGQIVANASPFLSVPNPLAVQIVVLCRITFTPINAPTLLALANQYTDPGFPNDAAQVFILNQDRFGITDLASLSAFVATISPVCISCFGDSQLPFAEIGLFCASGSSLLDDLFEIWTFENSLVGLVRGLTWNNAAPSYGTGKIGQGLFGSGVVGQNGSASSTGFSIAQSFTVAAWTNATSASPNFSALESSGTTSAFSLTRASAMGAPANCFFSLTHSAVAIQISTGGLTQNDYVLAMGGYDASTDKIFLRINNAAVVESAAIGAVPNSDINTLKTCVQSGSNNPATGCSEDILAMWQRRLTTAEMDAFYNGGNGIQPPF